MLVARGHTGHVVCVLVMSNDDTFYSKISMIWHQKLQSEKKKTEVDIGYQLLNY